MVNIEADVTAGRILKKRAAQAGVLYTVSSGDEPGCLAELCDYVTTLGFEVIVIGKGKNNPLDPSATTDAVAEKARASNKDPFQVASYVDGSKTSFEMCCSANATGCVPMRRGMVGPVADLSTVTKIFALKEDGGITPFPGVVDFVQGTTMTGGVFCVVRVASDRVNDDLAYLNMGTGKYHTFFRPYHLWLIEAPISVARACLCKQVWLQPLDKPAAEAMAMVKKNLKPGEMLDAFGGYTFYGTIERAEIAAGLNALPAGIAPGAKVINPVSKGSVITWDDVHLDETSTVVKLRREQDAMTAVMTPAIA